MLENTSLKFKHMSKNTTKIMIAMLTNQDLLRYVYYMGDYDPLDTKLDNVGLVTVKNENFILAPFNPEVLSSTKTMLFLNPFSGRFGKGVAADDVYTLDIIAPYDFWIIGETSELRVYSIAHQVARSVDQKNIAGVGNIVIVNYKAYKVDDTFSGITLFLEVANATYRN